jgi:signal transduction histidine kinase
MRRYFTLTFSALSKGLERLKTQLASPVSPELTREEKELETSVPTSASSNPSGSNGMQTDADQAIPPGTDSVSDNEDLVRGVRYLQNYSAVKLQEIVSRVMAEVTSGQDEHFKNPDFNMLEAGKQQTKDYQTWWLQDLIAKVAVSESLRADLANGATNSGSSFMPATMTASSSSLSTLSSGLSSGLGSNLNIGVNSTVNVSSRSSFKSDKVFDSDESDSLEAARKLMLELFTNCKNLTAEFNSLIAKKPELSKLRISTTEISSVKEKNAASFFRCRTSSASWSLNVRGSAGTIEIYLVPAAEIFLLSHAETSMRLKNILRLNQSIEKTENEVWSIDGLTADSDELFYLVRNLFKQLLLATVQETQDEMPGASILQNLEGEELRDAVNSIILAEQNMAQKIVSQQEEIQNRIARDLHDAVIADIMSLKRLLSGDKRLNNDEVVENLDQICTRLREICHDLAPRDLRDWGLQTVIEDLVERLAHRTGADCSFTCDGELPELPYPVQLHIYRIVQESLNNMEKYAKASKIIVKFEIDGKDIRITMRDNGQGFSMTPDGELRSKKEGGTGLSGIKERTEMIRCFFKTQLSVSSVPGEGSETVLEVKT